MKIFNSFFLVCMSLIGYSQENQYVFFYKYVSYAKKDALLLDTSSIKNYLYEQLINNMSIKGVVNEKSTCMTVSADTTQFIDSVPVSSNDIVHFQLNSNSGSSAIIIIKKDGIITIEKSDTAYFLNDSTVRFHLTGNKKIINSIKCREYKTSTHEYEHISIWASNDVPEQIMPGSFNGINNGIVEIDNKIKRYKVKLMKYKKNTQNLIPLINLNYSPTHTFKFISFYM